MSLGLQQLWQTTIETGVETGQAPLLDLGLSTEILPHLEALLALLVFAEERLDMAMPQVILGGASSGWLVALLALPPSASPERASALTVTYGGADQATQLASVGIYQDQTPVGQAQRRRELPPGYAPWFAPARLAATLSWSAWPFLFWTGASGALRTSADQWLQWAGLLVAVGLVILALLV
jgi:hypothetical protein